MARLRRSIAALFRDEGVIEIAIGVAIAYSLVNVVSAAVFMIEARHWDTYLAIREGLQLALVLAAALLLRTQLRAGPAETIDERST